MRFLRTRKFDNDHLRGPSVEALKLGAKTFYGEIAGGKAEGTPLLVEVKASRRKLTHLDPEFSGKLHLPEDLDVMVTIRAVNSGSATLFPDWDTDWDYLSLEPGEENEWLKRHPIRWATLDESVAKATSFWDLDVSLGQIDGC
ncbi:hypothetical protein ACSYDW_08640 [Paeniglutamicibacter sp. R2-26]|uniref:hypothetical protein n=1 Tax=Paeniglutamicibacter sp. R2-26 TaxID=3144417 RepID=UPI003EE434A0